MHHHDPRMWIQITPKTMFQCGNVFMKFFLQFQNKRKYDIRWLFKYIGENVRWLSVLSFIFPAVMNILPRSSIGEEGVPLDLFSWVVVHYCREVKAGTWASHPQSKAERGAPMV